MKSDNELMKEEVPEELEKVIRIYKKFRKPHRDF